MCIHLDLMCFHMICFITVHGSCCLFYSIPLFYVHDIGNGNDNDSGISIGIGIGIGIDIGIGIRIFCISWCNLQTEPLNRCHAFVSLINTSVKLCRKFDWNSKKQILSSNTQSIMRYANYQIEWQLSRTNMTRRWSNDLPLCTVRK